MRSSLGLSTSRAPIFMQFLGLNLNSNADSGNIAVLTASA